MLTGGAASMRYCRFGARDFEANVKLYVPNHMGLRNPVFIMSLALYCAISTLPNVSGQSVWGMELNVSLVKK